MPGLTEIQVLLFVAAALSVLVWPSVRIAGRLGFSRWLGLLAAIPVVNVALLWFVAYAAWPAAPAGREGA